MNKRLIIKTALISFGIFILIMSATAYFFLQNYEPVDESISRVLVAKIDIDAGTEVDAYMLEYRIIRVSGLNNYMLKDMKDAVGKKAINKTAAGDYIRSYDLLAPEQWHAADERAIVLPMDMEDRLGNLIKKGSFVDIKVILNDVKAIPQMVLSKIRVEELVDENGVTLGEANQSAKKVFAQFYLTEEQRNKIYAAKKIGKLIYELYLDVIQPEADEVSMNSQGFLSQSNNLNEHTTPSHENKVNEVASGYSDESKNSVSPASENNGSSSSAAIQQSSHIPDTLPSADPVPTYNIKKIPGYN